MEINLNPLASPKLKEEARTLRVEILTEGEDLTETELTYAKELSDYLDEKEGNIIYDTGSSKQFLVADLKNKFQDLFGVPYTPYNLENLRTQSVLSSDIVIAFKLDDRETFAVNLLQRIRSNTSNGAAILIARLDSTRRLSDRMLALKEMYPNSHIETEDFNTFEALKKLTDDFLNRALGFINLRGPKLGTTVDSQSLPIKKKNKLERSIFCSASNVGIVGTSYSERFNSPTTTTEGKVELFAEDTFKKATLHLQSGRKMTGYSFGADISATGELVFQTAMVGYLECLSDPSYRNQIVVCSSTNFGQYGVPPRTRDRYGLLEKFESEDIHIAGLVITDYSFNYNHFEAFQSLSDWLKKYNIPAIYGWEVDTRALILELRSSGSLLGKLIMEGDDESKYPYQDPNKKNLISEVSVKQPVYFEGGALRIILIDFGVKNGIARCLLDRGVSLTIVPWNHEFISEQYDGIMLSNGPGDPNFMTIAIQNLKKEMKKDNPVPIMGVCMGNQVLGIAAGAETYKLTYGNRGHNQPVVDLSTGKTFITSQNHGYAINAKLLPSDWSQYFMNLNDHSNEGIRHNTKPFFSVQFHPEACGGPWDTRFLFDIFLHNVVQRKYLSFTKPLLKMTMDEEKLTQLPGLNSLSLDPKTGKQQLISPYKLTWEKKEQNIKKVLVIGSGPLQIGQAGEFDYSGCQAINTLREEGIESILVNPNIATVQTKMKGLADRVYLSPLTVESVSEVIAKERPDGVFLGFGGQTALNLGIQLHDAGIFTKYGVQVLGTSIETLRITEDRELFNLKLQEINEPIAKGGAACSIEEAIHLAKDFIGFPVIIRAAFALGGLGSGFAENEKELIELCKNAFVTSNQVLIEKDLRGWKELEYEVVRDMFDNCITPAALENVNPMGIHTGESIVVCPLQTVTDSEHFRIRNKAIKIIRHLGVIGECNIQLAVNPTDSNEIYVIEVNARLSRSSALASKATCYPLAIIAAKLMLGYALPAVTNNVTGITSANFEPSLDYVVIKIPRWDMVKFNGVSRKLGSMMKSVGEVMAIGRNFEEAIQKGLRMIDPNQIGFHYSTESRAREEFKDLKNIEEELKRATDRQIFCIYQALKQGLSIKRIWELSQIDMWFLSKFKRIVEIETVISNYEELTKVPKTILKDAKAAGFSDAQIGKLFQVNELAVRTYRKSLGIYPCVKKIDTLGGEFPCETNNLYLSYNGQNDEVDYKNIQKGIIVLGGGCYRIGSSVEFDWCSVEFIKELQNKNVPTIMINNNPETVSTDHTISNRLYFEELTFESVMDICEKEDPQGVCVSYGGQLPQNIAIKLERNGVKILGHSSDSIDQAEDRVRFSTLLNELNINQPQWAELKTIESGIEFANRVGYPVICRPSYVLSGAAMRTINTELELQNMLVTSTDISPEHSVLISKFQANSMEVEFDGVAQNGEIIVYAISHHIENAGVHSGDATLIFPATDLSDHAMTEVMKITQSLCQALKVNGPFNVQYLYKDNEFKVIELNLRASRSLPFVSKVLGLNFMKTCAEVTLGEKCKPLNCDSKALGITHVGCKAPKFSYKRLLGSDPLLGLEMASTGEVGTIGENKYIAFLKSYQSTGDFTIPKRGSNVLISSDFDDELSKFMKNHLKKLAELYNVYFLTDYQGQIPFGTKLTFKDTENMIMEREFSLFMSLTRPLGADVIDNDFSKIRKRAIQFLVPALLNEQLSEWFTDAIYENHDRLIKYDKTIQEYHENYV